MNARRFLALLLALAAPVSWARAEKRKSGPPQYTYSADRFADPFVPSKGGGPQALLLPFDPVGAQVGGIVSTESGRIAVLRTAASGTYIIKTGRIYDVAGKAVPGYRADVETKTVTVWSTARNGARYVYRLRTEQGGDSR